VAGFKTPFIPKIQLQKQTNSMLSKLNVFALPIETTTKIDPANPNFSHCAKTATADYNPQLSSPLLYSIPHNQAHQQIP
jgi:hypothetical protein